jgi:hypothetical protein
MMKHLIATSAVLTATILSSGTASAAGVLTQPTAFNLTVDVGGNGSVDFDARSTGALVISDLDGGNGNLFGVQDGSLTRTDWSLDWSGMRFDPDPLLTGTVGITNLGTAAQNFTVNLFLPVTPAIPGATQYRGTVTATIFDRNGNSTATLDEAFPPTQNGIYAGKVDGVTQLDLLAQLLNCSSGPSCSASGTDQSTGYPGWIAGGPAVNSSIGTTLSFNLSPGDRVTFNTLFEVVPVPLPAALPMFLAGLGALSFARRGRRSLKRL